MKRSSRSYRIIRIIIIICIIAAACFIITRYDKASETAESPASDIIEAYDPPEEPQADSSQVPESVSGESVNDASDETSGIPVTLDDIPEYDIYDNMFAPYTEINGNKPFFDDSVWEPGYEYYPELDSLSRCGSCEALIGEETMPTGKRGNIRDIHPSGWKTYHYDFMGDDYLYNRCHLLGYKLSGENANPLNLITGTRYFNSVSMLPFEDEVAYYIYRTGNHVKMRVTPLFKGDDLVARGVLMEARSVEDNGEGVEYCVFCYNVQPGVIIDYSDGSTEADPDYPLEEYYGSL